MKVIKYQWNKQNSQKFKLGIYTKATTFRNHRINLLNNSYLQKKFSQQQIGLNLMRKLLYIK